MRYDKGHKDATHRHILNIAAKLFLKHGIDGVGIATIMKEAGLTNGGFYAHFKSKDALVAEMLDEILEQKETEYLSNNPDPLVYIKFYLSPLHRDRIECGCPISALLSELVHHSKATRKVLTKWSVRTVERIAAQLKGSEEERNKRALSIMAILFGSLQMARAVTDQELSDRILSGAYETAVKLVTGANEAQQPAT